MADLVCARCGRASVVRASPKCVFCGGTMTSAAAAAPPPSAPAAATPALTEPPRRAAATPGSGDAGRNTARSRPRADDDDEAPPLWQQLLQLPFTTPGGQKALGIAALIALFYLGVHLLLVSAKPKETQRGPAIVPRGNGAPYQPAPGPAPGDEPGNVRDPIQIRDERSTDAREDLLKIQEALMAYAAANNAFPTELSDDLRELSGFGGFGDMTRYLTRFEGHRLTAYRRTLSGDFRTDSVEIEALPRGLRRSIKASFVFERMAVNLPKPPPNWGDPNFTFPGER